MKSCILHPFHPAYILRYRAQNLCLVTVNGRTCVKPYINSLNSEVAGFVRSPDRARRTDKGPCGI
jgi:hypothetical protein